MVNDFMVCVDRIIASACFDSVNQRERLREEVVVVTENNASSLNNNGVVDVIKNINSDGGGEGCSKIVRECRICQEEDEEHEMEAPCACSGTLKFAHRKCIQKWCNKKGDITCEICNQVYSPNYTLPLARSDPDVMAIDIRQAWGQHINLRDSHFLALAAVERQFLQSEYEDYAVTNNGSIACFCSVVIVLMSILLIRQLLFVTRDFRMVLESSTFFNVSILQLAGFLLPCYVMARSWCIIQSRRRRQG
ncbi:uncharacterized protein LOC132302297 isoform X2 [Cornus florida]|uniref:uncharacterized protein LOC132302297 isoform X2 n=1 Tax=Cornus florida TaxID=4283 RepID=UPI00289A5CF0|nr:uncharacterized protein LOC132302297 isoform X2 [Cornus florida]